MKSIKQHFEIKNKENYSIREVVLMVVFISILLTTISSYLIYLYISKRNENDIMSTYNKIISSYLEEINEEELSDAAINGMMNYLGEKYSFFMDTDDASSLMNKLDGKYKGMGIKIKRLENNQMEILEVYSNTPAKKAGLKKGDIITQIDGIKIQELNNSQITELLLKKNKVKLEYIRNDKTYEVDVVIEELETPVVSSEIIKKDDKKIGYIYLSSFSTNAYNQVQDALNKFDKDKIDGLVFDVRSNSGGYLSSVTNILELFIKKGKPLYQIENKEEKKIYYAETDDYKKYPIVVLADSLSASASEILASALKESYGAIIIGTNTYGKGKVQQTLSLSNKGMVKYTTANWYTPNGEWVNEIGITPGIYVELTKEYALNPCHETDAQLQKALEIISLDY